MAAQFSDNVDVYVEIGKKRTFAGWAGTFSITCGRSRIGCDQGSVPAGVEPLCQHFRDFLRFPP